MAKAEQINNRHIDPKVKRFNKKLRNRTQRRTKVTRIPDKGIKGWVD